MPPTQQILQEADRLKVALDRMKSQSAPQGQKDLRADLGNAAVVQYKRNIAESSALLETAADPLYNDAPTDVSKLRRSNQIFRKYGLDERKDLPKPIGVVEEVGENIDAENIPFIGGVFTALDLWNVHAAAVRAEKGNATEEDWKRLSDFMGQAAKDSQERTFGGGVARILAKSAPFMAEFLASGGLVSGAKKAGKEVGEAAVKKSLSVILADMAKGALKATGKAGVDSLRRLPVFSHRVLSGQVSRTLPQFATILPEDGGEASFVVLEPGEGQLEAAKNALADTYIEIFSEQSGEILGVIGGALRKGKKVAPSRIGAREFLRKAGFHGTVGELTEERVGEALRAAATEIGAVDLPQELPSGEQLLQEATAFAVPAVGGAAIDKVGGKRVPLTPMQELGNTLISEHPEVAQEIALAKSASQKSFNPLKRVLPDVGRSLTAEQRQELQSYIRSVTKQIPSDDSASKSGQVVAEGGPEPPTGTGVVPNSPEYRSEYVFKADGEGKSLADQLRKKLPEGLQTKVRVVKKGHREYKTADANGIVEKIGLDEMAKAIMAKQVGDPRLAIPATEESGRAMARAAQEIDLLSGVPETRRREVVEQEAQARLDRNYAGEREKFFQAVREKRALNDVETAIAKAIFRKEAPSLASSGDLEQMQAAVKMGQAWRRTGTETARGLAMRFDPQETPEERRNRAIWDSILTPNEIVQNKINQFIKQGKDGEADLLMNEWAVKSAEIQRYLESIGVDTNNLDEYMASETKTQKLINEINAAKSSKWSIAHEWWRNALISPSGIVANLIGNTAMFMQRAFVERPLAAAFNDVVARSPDAPTLSELPHFYAGMLPGIARGVKNFFKSWDTERPVFQDELQRSATSKIEGARVAIKGKTGRVVRVMQRGLLAFDELQKTIIGTMEVGAIAHRIAKSDGLSGAAMEQRINQLVMNTNSAAWDEALRSAKIGTFQEGGPITEGVIKLRDSHPALYFLAPFVTTPAGIIKEGSKRGIVGAPRAFWKAYRALRTGNYSEVPESAVQQALSGALLWYVWSSNDPDEPWITGAKSSFKYSTRQQAYRTHPPNSIRVGDTWYDYSRIEPLATFLAVNVDTVDALQKGGDLFDVSLAPLESLAGQMNSKLFLQQVGDVIDAVDEGFNPDAFLKWASSFVTSWVPNVIRTGSREQEEYIPERGVWGDGDDRQRRWIRRILQKTELPQKFGYSLDQPKIDLWGRRIPRSNVAPPRSDFWYRVLVPVRRRTENIAIGDRVLMNWNYKHSDDPYHPVVPRKFFSIGGKDRWMNDAEFTQFLELSGKIANARLDVINSSIPFSIDDPQEIDIKRIEKVLTASRAQAKGLLLREWNENPLAERDSELVNRLLGKVFRNTPLP